MLHALVSFWTKSSLKNNKEQPIYVHQNEKYQEFIYAEPF
jgi:hypothetical protein